MTEFKPGDRVFHLLKNWSDRNRSVREIPAVVLWVKGKMVGIKFDAADIEKRVYAHSLKKIEEV